MLSLTLDTEQDQVAYDLSDWDDDRLTALVDELDAAGIAHGWDEDETAVRLRRRRAGGRRAARSGRPSP